MSQFRIGYTVFPGTNCDHDIKEAIETAMNAIAVPLWHGNDNHDKILSTLDGLILPGGFSYGDYLRCGAMAKQSALMQAVKDFADAGKPVLGICNGFQILTESGLLPGALVRNKGLTFICEQRTSLEVVNASTVFSDGYSKSQTVEMPIAHGEGCYIADEQTLADLEANNQVVIRYVNDVNGSANRIAGIVNKAGNVMGMMPHPERNLVERSMSQFSGEGASVFQAWAKQLEKSLTASC